MKKTCSALFPVLAALVFIPALAEAGTPIDTLTGATTAHSFDNANNQQTWTWNSLGYGYGLVLESNGTTAGTVQVLLNAGLTGANSAASTSTAGQFINVHTGTGSLDYGLYAVAGTSTYSYGIYSNTESTNAGNAGVWGDANGGSGATYGVYGTNGSATGYAGYFNNSNGGYAAAFMGGNVGIGTATPDRALVVRNSGYNQIVARDATTGISTNIQGYWPSLNFNALYNSGASQWQVDAGGYYTGEIYLDPSGGGMYFGTGSNGASGSNAAMTAKVAILNSGAVGIGNTSPAYLLHVGSSSASGTVAEFQNSAGNCTINPPGNGTLGVSCSSDARLKGEIVDSGSALTSLADIRVRDYTLKSTGTRQTGVIAQELQSGHPDMVHLGKDGFYTVEAPNPWKLLKAIQELKADNDKLEARLAALEAARH